ncbi:MAG: flagellar biosynthetic protein, partial [Pseudomonadota bacterium]
QAEKLGNLIQDGMRDATLHVHPEDLNLFGEFECGVNVTADPVLMRGTLRLVHGDGWIEQGSQPLLDELQAMLDEMEQAS